MMTETTELEYDTVADFLTEECDIHEMELEAFWVYLRNQHEIPESLFAKGETDTLRERATSFRDDFMGVYDSESAWGDDWIEQTGMLDNLDENLRPYFNVESFARDAFMSDLYSLELPDGSIAVFHY